MDFMELAKSRYSVRSFSDKAVGDELVGKILEAGQAAPTACNKQPQAVTVVRTPEAMQRLKKCTDFTFDAPLAFIISYDREQCWTRPFDGRSSGDIDASIVATHMMLEAFDLGIGSTWVMYFKPDVLREEFCLPLNLDPVAILVCGWPAENAHPSKLHSTSKPLTETVSYA